MKRASAAAVLAVVLSVATAALEADLGYVDDITELTGQCYIQAIKLEAVTEENGADVTALEGTLRVASGKHAVRVAREDGAVTLWVDLGGTGSVTQTEWERILVDGTLLADVQLQATYSDGERSPYRLFLMWSEFLPTVLTYCRNSYREGAIPLGERSVRIAVIDADTDGRYDRLDGGILLVDADGDGELLATGDSHERFALGEPFNVDGTTYRVAALSENGASIRIEESEETVAPKAPLLPGYAAPEFSGTGPDGEVLSLNQLHGGVVVLDFWAAWCGPCLAELPTLRRIVDEFGPLGVTVLGINLDRTAEAFAAALEEHDVDWPQIYDGSDGQIGELYRIEGIPMIYLVDGDGSIVARGLRGERLIDAVAAITSEGGRTEPEDGGGSE